MKREQRERERNREKGWRGGTGPFSDKDARLILLYELLYNQMKINDRSSMASKENLFTVIVVIRYDRIIM